MVMFSTFRLHTAVPTLRSTRTARRCAELFSCWKRNSLYDPCSRYFAKTVHICKRYTRYACDVKVSRKSKIKHGIHWSLLCMWVFWSTFEVNTNVWGNRNIAMRKAEWKWLSFENIDSLRPLFWNSFQYVKHELRTNLVLYSVHYLWSTRVSIWIWTYIYV